MKKQLSEQREQLFWDEVYAVAAGSRLPECSRYIQHGTISVYRHSVAVAYLSCLLAEQLHIKVCWSDMIRGALLHDYFLYDWHMPGDGSHRLHGFRHPAFALHNATTDFELSPRERNIILRHMFPLTPIPPLCREAWLVCLADKICSSWETAHFTSSQYGRWPHKCPHGEPPCEEGKRKC